MCQPTRGSVEANSATGGVELARDEPTVLRLDPGHLDSVEAGEQPLRGDSEPFGEGMGIAAELHGGQGHFTAHA